MELVKCRTLQPEEDLGVVPRLLLELVVCTAAVPGTWLAAVQVQSLLGATPVLSRQGDTEPLAALQQDPSLPAVQAAAGRSTAAQGSGGGVTHDLLSQAHSGHFTLP